MNKEFKVIKILNEYEILINAGTVHGICKDDVFEIKHEMPILDLDTNDQLGTFPFVKARVHVIEVYEKFCLCEDADNGTMFQPFASAVFKFTNPMEPHVRYEKLNIDTDDLTDSISEPDRMIRIGDKALLSK